VLYTKSSDAKYSVILILFHHWKYLSPMVTFYWISYSGWRSYKLWWRSIETKFIFWISWTTHKWLEQTSWCVTAHSYILLLIPLLCGQCWSSCVRVTYLFADVW